MDHSSGVLYPISETSPIERSGHSTNWINDRLFLFGGYNGDERLNDVWTLNDLDKGEENVVWNKVDTANTITARAGHTSPQINDNSFVIYGGYDSHRNLLSDMHVFDTHSQTFSPVPYSKTISNLERRWHSSHYLPNHQLLTYGGWNKDGPLDDLIIFDFKSKSWLPPLKQKNGPNGGRRWHSSLLASPQKLLIYGGYNGNKNPLDDLWTFDCVTLQWTLMKPKKPIPGRCRHTMNLIGTKQLLVVGGFGIQDQPPLKGIHILHLDDMSWSSFDIGSLFPLTRAGHSTNMISENVALVFGGYDVNNNLLNETFLLDVRCIK